MSSTNPISRRDFVALAAMAAGAGLALPRSARALLQESQPATTVFTWKNVSERARVAFEMGGNALVVGSGGSALLVDCKNAGYGSSLRAESEAFAGPLSWVVNTHHHADHTGGNAVFSKSSRLLAHQRAEPRILSQYDRYVSQIANLKDELARSSEPWAEKVLSDSSSFIDNLSQVEAADFGPNDLVTDAGRELRVGELRVELVHIGAGHTDNDLFIQIAGLNLIHTGDLVFHKLHPFFDRPAGANIDGWIGSLEAIADRCNDKTVVVPGHGEITDVTGVRAQIDYFKKTRDAVQKAINDNKTRDQVMEMTFPHFEGVGFEQLRGRLLGGVYDELTEKKR